MALLGDLMIVSAFAYLFYGMPDETNMLIVFSIITFILWKDTGGFSNWKISTVKKFLKNWDLIIDG